MSKGVVGEASGVDLVKKVGCRDHTEHRGLRFRQTRVYTQGPVGSSDLDSDRTSVRRTTTMLSRTVWARTLSKDSCVDRLAWTLTYTHTLTSGV